MLVALCFTYNIPFGWKTIFPFRDITHFICNILMIHTVVSRVWNDLILGILCWSKHMISLGYWTANEKFNHGWKTEEKFKFSLSEFETAMIMCISLDCHFGFILCYLNSSSHLNNSILPFRIIPGIWCGSFPSHHSTLFLYRRLSL